MGMPLGRYLCSRRLYRADGDWTLTALIGLIGDFDAAEEAAQAACAAAVIQWPASGVPEFPRAWIIETVHYKAIGRMRSQGRFQEKLESYLVPGFCGSQSNRTTMLTRFPTSTSPDFHLLPPGASPRGGRNCAREQQK